MKKKNTVTRSCKCSKIKCESRFPTPIQESNTIGFQEGYYEGRNHIVEELVKYGILKKNWKSLYDEKLHAGK